jgi:hypothetical protein
MNVRGSLATASLIACAMGGCVAHPGEGDPSEEAPADQPLDLTVDSIEIVHGALRVSATMVDGSADVTVRLGGECDHREVGGGMSTLSSLVWALGDNDVAEALSCGLVVRARVRDGVLYVNKLAELAVMVDVAPQDSENGDEGPRLQTVTMSEVGVNLVFAPLTRGARLRTGESILEAAPPESEEKAPSAGDETGRFTVPRIDFARSVLRGRALSLDGSSFATSLSVGGAPLQGEPREEAQEELLQEPPEDEPEEAPQQAM